MNDFLCCLDCTEIIKINVCYQHKQLCYHTAHVYLHTFSQIHQLNTVYTHKLIKHYNKHPYLIYNCHMTVYIIAVKVAVSCII